ncbi:hypothetical protein NQ315_003731 [Exocentrus adspersus]|uniref:Uncharacterized protein n=1 Tax=Exocentrus adspersus TaxID=1586481 RepID=A0AAV8VIW0_9CUCU|nr:hypothetical protein NQ315_003731 [Exocentrus adspersus]
MTDLKFIKLDYQSRNVCLASETSCEASNTDNVDGAAEKSFKGWNSMVEAETRHNRDVPQVTLSQPNMVYRPSSVNQLINEFKGTRREQVCFSQPTQNDNLIIQFTQSPVTKDNFHNLCKRMTRFYVTTSYEMTLEALCSVLDTLHYSWNIDASSAVTISTVDVMKTQLIFKANLFEMDNKILLDFRLSKGCGLEFKKKFLKVKSCLCDIIDNCVL